MRKIPTKLGIGKASDISGSTALTMLRPTPAQAIAARRIAEKTGFSPSLSATVATLAMLGGAR